MKRNMLCLLLVALALLPQCNKPEETTAPEFTCSKEFWGMHKGDSVFLYRVIWPDSSVLSFSNFGCTVTGMKMRDKDGKLTDIVLGFDSLAQYQASDAYLGTVVGRYANRIKEGKFTIDTASYQLACNNGPNHLHGGIEGFNKKAWKPGTLEIGRDSIAMTFSLQSPDGDEGFPGTLDVQTDFIVSKNKQLTIRYKATTDKPTVVNLTHHMYFNLTDGGKSTNLDHTLELRSSRFVPVDTNLIPKKEFAAVEGTPFDFRQAKTIGLHIEATDEQLEAGNGFDHTWILDYADQQPALAARVFSPISGIGLEVWTDQPGIQFYSGNFMDGKAKGRGGVVYNYRTGLCLEPQKFPDSPNRPDFPTVVLRPGEIYTHTSVYKFLEAKK